MPCVFGLDGMMLQALAAGATGFVGSTYNYAAPLYLKLMDAWKKGDVETARLCQYRAIQFINLQTKYGDTRGSKFIVKLVCVDCGPPRLPLKPLSREEENSLEQELAEIGFFGWRVAL